MLKWPPPTETGPACRRSASCDLLDVVGVATAQTGTGLRPVTSLTMRSSSWPASPASVRTAR